MEVVAGEAAWSKDGLAMAGPKTAARAGDRPAAARDEATPTDDALAALIEADEAPPPELDDFTLHTLMTYTGVATEYDAYQLASRLGDDE